MSQLSANGVTTEVVLRDLHSLLRQTLGDQLVIENFTTTSLLPPGENYGSTMLKIDAVIRRNEYAEKEDLHLVAKMVPPTEFQRMVFDSPHSFRKEISMYEEIIPAYNRLEMEFGINEEQVFNILPKLYGSRLSLCSETDFDDNAVMLMENLNVIGYSCGKRKIGYDFDHAKMAVTAMVRFHALGLAMKFKKPALFEKLRMRSKPLAMKDDDGFDGNFKIWLSRVDSNPEIKQYRSNIEAILQRGMKSFLALPPEPWGSIVHSDFWVNNIMFHHDKNGKPDGIKFVDFQNYIYISPLRELIFFLYSSCDKNVRSHHIDELMNLYHDSLILHLTRMDCDVAAFSRDKFDTQMKSDANLELIHCMFMLKMMTLDTEDEPDAADFERILLCDGSQAYNDRFVGLVQDFAKKGWV